MGNGSLVIELAVDMRKDNEVTWRTDYKLYKDKKIWDAAAAHCKSKGGQLASIHSEAEQILAERAKRAAGKNSVWLGGRRGVGAEWGWSDNSTWGFTNWRSSEGDDDNKCLYMHRNGYWYDYDYYKYLRRYVLCQGNVTLNPERS